MNAAIAYLTFPGDGTAERSLSRPTTDPYFIHLRQLPEQERQLRQLTIFSSGTSRRITHSQRNHNYELLQRSALGSKKSTVRCL